MLTLSKYVKPLSRFKTHWSFWTGSAVQMPDHIVRGYTVTYELTFHPAMTPDQRADAIRFFREAAFKQDQQEMRARFIGLFARRSLATWDMGVAA
jgi:hypothetical protein